MELFERIAMCVSRGKINQTSPYPPDLRGQEGVFELVRDALASGTNPNDILTRGLMVGMNEVGKKFSKNEVFVPDLLMAAKAMTAGMDQLKPAFESGAAQHRGVFVIGTVQGDLHDIGKNLVRMMMEGAGYEVIDLGVDVSPEKFMAAVQAHPGCVVGLSALLTTTMVNMEKTTKMVKDLDPKAVVVVGGAPLTQEFCDKIGADAYSPDPQGIIDWLDARCCN
ncbi:MAG: corrinoid protein [Candidatus Hydrogenedentes bacterium]|nr:corrinoid protein [Candidatus Hydrogenedentota bacterium]